MSEQPVMRTIDSRITEISIEGKVAPECALVRVFVEGIDVPVRDSIVLSPNRAKTLLVLLGLSNYDEAKGAVVTTDYAGSKLEGIYLRAQPEWQ